MCANVGMRPKVNGMPDESEQLQMLSILKFVPVPVCWFPFAGSNKTKYLKQKINTN